MRQLIRCARFLGVVHRRRSLPSRARRRASPGRRMPTWFAATSCTSPTTRSRAGRPARAAAISRPSTSPRSTRGSAWFPPGTTAAICTACRSSRLDPSPQASIVSGGDEWPLEYKKDYVMWSMHDDSRRQHRRRSRLRRIRHRRARVRLERLRGRGREGEGRRGPGQHARHPRLHAVPRQVHDLLRPLDLQARGGRAAGRGRRPAGPHAGERHLRVGHGHRFLDRTADPRGPEARVRSSWPDGSARRPPTGSSSRRAGSPKLAADAAQEGVPRGAAQRAGSAPPSEARSSGRRLTTCSAYAPAAAPARTRW